ncbi:hypothetical protein LX32DRAFT_634990 [Colletotrichum zoysiae]|uniref:Uncharacterized protein n=1 Tax=Colletotrichum zoysiae TaxID=1216348 RepID=A0AAD9HTT3_9PEZI|nr:hypothetical protein LX32DRAFT_634990 [Colletotrichum zoysiae]
MCPVFELKCKYRVADLGPATDYFWLSFVVSTTSTANMLQVFLPIARHDNKRRQQESASFFPISATNTTHSLLPPSFLPSGTVTA